MKKIALLLVLVLAIGLVGCGENAGPDVIEEEPPIGIAEDGKGEVNPLTKGQQKYLLEHTTETWLGLDKEHKDEIVVLIGRWWEAVDGKIVEDYDEMVSMLDHQMEQYHKNGVNESLFATACDIFEVDVKNYK